MRRILLLLPFCLRDLGRMGQALPKLPADTYIYSDLCVGRRYMT